MADLQNSVKPALHVRGHMHVFGDLDHADGSRVISLDRDTFAGNVGVLEMSDLGFTPLSMAVIRGLD